MNATLCALASSSALFSGTFASYALLKKHLHDARQNALKQKWQAHGTLQQLSGQEQRSGIARLERFDMLHSSVHVPVQAKPLLAFSAKGLQEKLVRAGVGNISWESAALWRVRSAAACACVGLFTGALFSVFACFVGLGIGFFIGWSSLGRMLSNQMKVRKRALERHISEAVEVLCLGLRSGLSFERSLELYCTNFPSPLSRELSLAQQVWNTGLLTREEALKNVAATYDSLIFSRVVESIVRSLRFGAPLADSLEDLAHEARRAHRTQVEEAVMKAPVKMMMPIGLLIVPSMLLLVMGPIMLELIQGF